MAAFRAGRWCVPLRCRCSPKGSRSGEAARLAQHGRFILLPPTGKNIIILFQIAKDGAAGGSGQTPDRSRGGGRACSPAGPAPHQAAPGRAPPPRQATGGSGSGSPRRSEGLQAWGCAPLPAGPGGRPRAEPSGAGRRRRRRRLPRQRPSPLRAPPRSAPSQPRRPVGGAGRGHVGQRAPP
ncbi:PREDICTED: cuticle collagen 8-like [Calidris pugnax]|uniref:cuticle collagen 8-like n=1 Tax=Calidris pugnax TaxID=198806 RepID=UPI00071E0C8E|nr:PREDICTED: cuticle collagen 8-like [Calidris pugnax]